MSELMELNYTVSNEDFTRAGEASSDVKKKLKQLGVSPDAIRKVAIALYEGEINMIIHAYGGKIKVTISENEITLILADKGPGIADIDKAMQAGYSTAPDKVRSLGFGAGMGLPNMKKNSDKMDIQTEIIGAVIGKITAGIHAQIQVDLHVIVLKHIADIRNHHSGKIRMETGGYNPHYGVFFSVILSSHGYILMKFAGLFNPSLYIFVVAFS